MRSVRPPEAAVICAICDRTLLVGERATRFTADGGESYVDVCPLCSELALQHGWVKEGSPTTPAAAPLRRRRRLSLAAIFDPRRVGAEEPVVSEPILRRLSRPEQAIVEAAELFNGSTFRRTVSGIARSLGPPTVSVVPLSGVNTEVVVTVAWDLSWYQYRVSFDAAQPVRLAERGEELDELEPAFREWNAELADDGRLLPNIARV
ncbi:MAG: hypothetical protein ABR583_01720 [Gaiellaceae bacterium]